MDVLAADPKSHRGSPAPIKAVPVRHPGRWITVGVLVVVIAMFTHMLVTNQAFQWSFMLDNMFQPPVLDGVWTTLLLTVLAMLIGSALGIVFATMRLSPNPILRGGSWTYIWFFRSVPRLVLAVLFGNLGILYQRLDLGFPFDQQLAALLNINPEGRILSIDARAVLTGFAAGLLALALSEAAYMAEIVRAGIQSVDPGQAEAAHALGMTRGMTLRRIVLPQAMRVIIPPTGNETIGMLKDTALVAFVPVTTELFYQLQAVGARTFQVFPMYVAACLWYLALTSVLLVGQHFLERHLARSQATAPARTRLRLGGIDAERQGLEV